MDRAELELFARTLRRATESHTSVALDAALDEMGWKEAFANDARAAVSTLFELQGETGATSSAFDHILATAFRSDTDSSSAVLLPALGTRHPPGRLDGESLAVRGLGTAALSDRDTVLVVWSVREEEVAIGVRKGGLTLRPVRGLDPRFGLVEVTGQVSLTGEHSTMQASGWTSAVALGQLALGHELVGASRKMLELARAHSLERIQFGRPIGTFQAVRHRLAESLVAIETADAMLAAAWEDRSPQTAAMAKALAGRGARTVARHCQQVLAGIGFTTEHPFHGYVRRVIVLDQLLGSARTLTRELGTELLERRTLPPLLPL